MQQEIKKVLKTINRKVRANHELAKVVNSGGCGWVTYFTMLELEKLGLLGVTDVIYLDDWAFSNEKEIETNLARRKGKVSASHIMLKIDGLYFDAISTRKSINWRVWDRQQEFVVRTTHSCILDALERPNQWNSKYKTHKWNDVLQEIISKSFKNYDETSIQRGCIDTHSSQEPNLKDLGYDIRGTKEKLVQRC